MSQRAIGWVAPSRDSGFSAAARSTTVTNNDCSISARSSAVLCESERWYVVHAQPHSERRAIINLERQGYRVFCPRSYKTIRHARKLTRSLAPMFPGYLFILLDVSRDHWHSVNGTRGVVRLIGQGDVPIAVPGGVVEALQVRLGADGAVHWTSPLKEGQAVRIADGPFADVIGTLERLDESGRVRVLLEMLGQSVSVTLRCETLMPIA